MSEELRPCPWCGGAGKFTKESPRMVECTNDQGDDACSAVNDLNTWQNSWANERLSILGKKIKEQSKLLESCFDALLETNHEHIAYQNIQCHYCDLIKKIEENHGRRN
jgi:hypothetical protein